MGLVLVQHDISKQIVEIDEIHLAHPVLGPHYKPVRVNEEGEVFVLKPTADEDVNEVEADAEAADTATETKKGDK